MTLMPGSISTTTLPYMSRLNDLRKRLHFVKKIHNFFGLRLTLL